MSLMRPRHTRCQVIPVDLVYFYLEIDKIGDEWIVRYYPDAAIRLQIRIKQYSYEFPVVMICEIRLSEAKEWSELSRFEYDISYLLDDCDVTCCVCCFPESFRATFVNMARHWSNLCSLTAFAPSAVVWKEGVDNPIFVDVSATAPSTEAESEANVAVCKPMIVH